MRPLLYLAALLAVAGRDAPSPQARPIDSGTFRLVVNGERVGREQFTIRVSPIAGGANLVAQATITMGTRTLSPQLTTDSAGHPIRYAIDVTTNDHVDLKLRTDATGGRFITKSSTSGSQAEQETRLVPGTLILDDDVVHQYYFIGQARSAGRVVVFSPRAAARDNLTITNRGSEQVETGNGTLPATHLILTNGAGAITDLWIDAAGRVLRVAIPARRFEAVREEPPR